jgi:hypothetical protein
MAESKNVHLYVQEGGSSMEAYVSAWPTKREAEAGRRDCMRASYRATSVMTFPRKLADTPGFYEAVEEVLRTYLEEMR